MIRIFMIGYSPNKGGVEAYIQNLDDNINHEAFEMVYSEPEMIIDGRKWVKPSNRHNYIKYWLFWEKFYTNNHFDVVYLNACDIVSIDDLKFAKRAGVPVRIIHSHSTGIQENLNKKQSLFHKITEKLNRISLEKYATHFFACSDVAGEWMFDGRDYKIIKNGIDLPKYAYSSENRSKIRNQYKLDRGPVVACIGRLDPPKNLFFSIDVFKEIKKNNEYAQLVLIGDGQCRKELEEYVVTKGLAEAVVFVGAVDNVYEWLSALDCILMPSLFEGLPFVLVEAQANGLSCVVSSAVSTEANIGGLIEFIDLEQSLEYWAERVLKAAEKGRVDVSQKLIDAGYSIRDTADVVDSIIKGSLDDNL